MLKFSSRLHLVCMAGLVLLAACSPKFDWREVRGAGAPYIATLPGKPASHTRQIDLDGLPVTMTMTATEVDDVVFAIGAAELKDPMQTPKALHAMKTALIKNIGGTVKQEKSSAPGVVPIMIEIEASGPAGPNTGSQPRLLLARFFGKDKFIYQVVVVGNEKAVSRDAVDTFFTSFKPD